MHGGNVNCDPIPNALIMKRDAKPAGEDLLDVGRAWTFDNLDAFPWVTRTIDAACAKLEPVEHELPLRIHDGLRSVGRQPRRRG